MTDSQELIVKRTRAAFIWTRVLGSPFWGLLSLLSVIMYKDLHISPLQITLIIALKPMSALLAPYWSQVIYQRPDRVVSNLVFANLLRYLPFLFVPWIESSWIIILAFASYMVLNRGMIPAWMETVKCNLPKESRESLVAHGSTVEYCGNALLPLALGLALDGYEHAWRWLFPLTAVIGLISTWFLWRIPTPASNPEEPVSDPKVNLWLLFKNQMVSPWKQSWHLVKENAGFANYQIGFMLGGAGLMVMQPALPAFFVDTLNLSYTKMLLAISVCKGIGFVIASPFWIKLFRQRDIYYFSGLVTVLAALFPFLLLISPSHIVLLYIAYGVYGVMQGGSELSWHMSGPLFAKEKDSTLFSGTNVLTVGIRGCIAPSFGALLYSLTNSSLVMVFGGLLCLLATQTLMRYSFSNKTAQQI